METSSIGQPPPTPLDEELARQQIEEKLRSEYQVQDDLERAEELATAYQALNIWKFLLRWTAIIVGVPLTALSWGFAVRGFRWASGLW